MNDDLTFTLIGLAACVALGLFSYRQHTRENNSLKPRMVPWILIAMACLATTFMLAVHLVNVLGLETGRR